MFRGQWTVILASLWLSGCVQTLPPAPPPVAQPPVLAPQVAAEDTADAGSEDVNPVDDRDGAIDDEPDDEDGTSAHGGQRPQAPALALDDAAFAKALKDDPTSLGCMSIGRPSAGILVNGVQMPEGQGWRLVDPGHAWGTQESVDAIEKAIQRVRDTYADTPPISIGHISAQHGGPLSPHKSHQAGRDVDIGYYYTTKSAWFARATPSNLDRARSWALVKAFCDADVEMIFIDTSVQRMLRDYALSHGEDRELVDRIFQVGSKNARTIVRHIPGHATHLHVRFWSSSARDVGARAEPFYRTELTKALATRAPQREERRATRSKESQVEKAQPAYSEHRVRTGETLYLLAQRYGTTVEAIQRANGLKGFALKPKMVLRIPKG